MVAAMPFGYPQLPRDTGRMSYSPLVARPGRKLDAAWHCQGLWDRPSTPVLISSPEIGECELPQSVVSSDFMAHASNESESARGNSRVLFPSIQYCIACHFMIRILVLWQPLHVRLRLWWSYGPSTAVNIMLRSSQANSLIIAHIHLPSSISCLS